jgi:NAD(P)-dependent dehydrogenase (short-subunit alcohol dehydrogenase family)
MAAYLRIVAAPRTGEPGKRTIRLEVNASTAPRLEPSALSPLPAVVVISGPTSGIGLQIARDLAATGASLLLACRDTAKGEAVAADLRGGGAAAATVLHLDAADASSIDSFARACAREFPRIDVLVNNAGVAHAQRQITGDGYELTFATNVLGYHRLSLALLDQLRVSSPARIVNVASTFAGDLDLDDLQFERRRYDELQAYAQSKACNRLLTWALARRLEGSGVTANAMAPGFVPATGLSRDLSPDVKRMYATRTGRSLKEGADTAVWLAVSRDVDGVSGRFFYDRRERPCELRNQAMEEQLWSLLTPGQPASGGRS